MSATPLTKVSHIVKLHGTIHGTPFTVPVPFTPLLHREPLPHPAQEARNVLGDTLGKSRVGDKARDATSRIAAGRHPPLDRSVLMLGDEFDRNVLAAHPILLFASLLGT